MKAEKLQHLLDLGSHSIDSDSGNKSQFEFFQNIKVNRFSCHLIMQVSVLYILYILVIIFSLFIDQLPPHFKASFLSKLLFQVLGFQHLKFIPFFLRVSGTSGSFFIFSLVEAASDLGLSRNFLFLLFFALYDSSWKRGSSFF